MSNFEFLKSEWSDIYDLAKEAEEFVYSVPAHSALLERNALETAVKWMFKCDSDLDRPYDDNLNSLLNEPSFKKIFADYPFMLTNVHAIRKVGNLAAHDPKKVTQDDAKYTLKALFGFLYWFYSSYSENPIKNLKYDENLIPNIIQNDEKIKELEKQIQAYKNQIDEKTKLEKENAELLKQVQAIKDKNKEAKKSALENKYFNEAQTRKFFIDLLLKEVGWDISAPNATEYEVQGMPNPTGLGYVDYVLWGDDGKPLGLVEAKKTSVDATVGREQAKLYADCLEKKFGVRPVIFYSNGYEHYIWDDLDYPPRRVSGFYSKEDLERLITRRTIKKDLTNIEINKEISGRPYQERVIKSVCENFRKKNRKSLLVMATGTGKTRVSISIVDILTRYNWAKRILFLADRTPLVVQAQRNFAKHLPQLNPVDITKYNSDGTNSRVVVSTYHTMMNLIDSKKDDQKVFSTGYFDLVIVDEAHRSIYKKFGEIFHYFDALLLGLTATPRDEVDKNTYEVFELENGVPTDCYEYKEAVEQGYLVPYEQFECETKFLSEGIKYDELSEEEKEEYESKFYDEENDILPDEIDSEELNKWLFNVDTVDKILECLMVNGIKVNGGNKLGKTIIFAANEKHAQFIAERFDKNYPESKGQFARAITYSTKYAQNLIDDFSVKDKEPTIAISVDKLDTGVDVPEVLNLVFFKKIRSKIKFNQMIGRGTRLCPNLFGPNDDKKKFFIFDACENFKYFSGNPPIAGPSNQLSLKQKIFLAKLELAEKIKNDDEILKLLSNKFKDELCTTVKTMNPDNFIVRRHLRTVEEFSNRNKWENLDDIDFITVKNIVSSLPTTISDTDELAQRFDLIVLNAQLSYYAREMRTFEKYQNKIKLVAFNLEKKSSIPLVQANIQLIEDILTDDFWTTITISTLEEIRLRLRELVKLIDFEEREIVYTNFEDELNFGTSSVDVDTSADINLEQYKKKVETFLRSHENEVAINKLKFNKPLTALDVEQLEKILNENADIVGTKDKFKTLMGNKSLGEFIRSIVGLDNAEIEKVFAKYLDTNNFNVNQIRFIDKIISYLRINGIMLDIGTLYESPFTDLSADGIDGIFSTKDADNIIYLINEINKNAKLYKEC